MSCFGRCFYFSPVVGFKIKVPLFRIFLKLNICVIEVTRHSKNALFSILADGHPRREQLGAKPHLDSLVCPTARKVDPPGAASAFVAPNRPEPYSGRDEFKRCGIAQPP